MTSYPPNTPRLAKVALVVFSPGVSTPSVITFQYNPETLSRDVSASIGEGGAVGDAFRLGGAASESLKMEAVFDATDDLADDEGDALAHGVRHRLAALEVLLHPSVASVRRNAALLALGTIEILPAEAPFTVLVMGARVQPVRLSALSVTEEAFDTELNPIRARVSLDFAVLGWSDLPRSHPGYALSLAHQSVIEQLARRGRAAAPSSILSRTLGSQALGSL